MSESTTPPVIQQLNSLSLSEQVKFIENWFYSKYGKPDYDGSQTTPFGSYVTVYSASFEEEEDLRQTFEANVTPEVFQESLDALVYETTMWSPDEEGEEEELPLITIDLYNAWQTANPTTKTQSFRQKLEGVIEQLSKFSGYNGGPVLGAATEEPPLRASVLRALQTSTSRMARAIDSNQGSEEHIKKYTRFVKTAVRRLGGWISENLNADIGKFRAGYAEEMGKMAARATDVLFIELFCRLLHLVY